MLEAENKDFPDKLPIDLRDKFKRRLSTILNLDFLVLDLKKGLIDLAFFVGIYIKNSARAEQFLADEEVIKKLNEYCNTEFSFLRYKMLSDECYEIVLQYPEEDYENIYTLIKLL